MGVRYKGLLFLMACENLALNVNIIERRGEALLVEIFSLKLLRFIDFITDLDNSDRPSKSVNKGKYQIW